ncbi:chemotaxis protein CheW [Laspinema sp. D1]|uniref:Chemotaxis protein CheW n=1 Tax=Laspinema palackyanum D2a TaxID=2953684 RepID=A0ABT2MXZ1_9CYAN|nr:chemotaxis protein CheW [Laspinema sp. D2b]MCT7969624.1 chemotaxis protein CheW [Laspinema sp. D2a]
MTHPPNPNSTFIFFELAHTTYAIPSPIVQQMEMIDHITPVPKTQPFVEGVVFSRGQVIPVVNLRVKFGLEKIPYNCSTRLIVIHINQRTIGLIVDTAREFVCVPPESIQPPPEEMPGWTSRYLSGIATLKDRVILLLNVDQLLNQSPSIEPLTQHPI